jgi:hypothetical protein
VAINLLSLWHTHEAVVSRETTKCRSEAGKGRTIMKKSLVVLSVVLVTVFVGVPAHVHGLQASPQAPDPHHPDQGAAAVPDATTSELRQHMMRMMSEMKVADKKLDELVQAMNAAEGPEKTDAIAALVTALVKEHGATCSSMTMMMSKMDKTSAMGDMATGKPKP